MVSTYDKVLSAIDDGQWHRRESLATVTPFLDEWLAELRHDGYVVLEDSDLVRLLSERQNGAPAPAGTPTF